MALVAHFTLQDRLSTSNVLAAVGSNGTLTGAGNTVDSAKSGPGHKWASSLRFDGTSDYVDLGVIAAPTVMSVALWLRPISLAGNVLQWGNAMLRLTGTGFDWLPNLGLSGNALTATIPLNKWTHVALTHAGTGANDGNLYINGLLTQTFTPALAVLTTGLLATIGRGPVATPSWFNGDIADVRIYDEELTGVAIETVRKLGVSRKVLIQRGA